MRGALVGGGRTPIHLVGELKLLGLNMPQFIFVRSKLKGSQCWKNIKKLCSAKFNENHVHAELQRNDL